MGRSVRGGSPQAGRVASRGVTVVPDNDLPPVPVVASIADMTDDEIEVFTDVFIAAMIARAEDRA